jgi:predicted transcriptional regulator
MAYKVIKMSVNLPSDDVKVLRELAKKRGTTMTEVIRQAIGNERYMEKVKEEEGKILIEDKKGNVRQLVFR